MNTTPSVVERLGLAMRELSIKGVTVTAEALYEHCPDFTRDEIREHGADARRWAQRRFHEAA